MDVKLTQEEENYLVLEKIMKKIQGDIPTCSLLTIFTSKNIDEEYSLEDNQFPLVIYFKIKNKETNKEEFTMLDFFDMNSLFTNNVTYPVNGENIKAEDYRQNILDSFDEIKNKDLYLSEICLTSDDLENLKVIKSKQSMIKLDDELNKRTTHKKTKKV